MKTYCFICYEYLGHNSTRQLCHKLFCINTSNQDVIDDNHVKKLRNDRQKYNKKINKIIYTYKEESNRKYIKYIRYYSKKIYRIDLQIYKIINME